MDEPPNHIMNVIEQQQNRTIAPTTNKILLRGDFETGLEGAFTTGGGFENDVPHSIQNVASASF
jgi:hypothetical protein